MPSLPQYQHPAKTKRWVAHNLAARMLAQPWTLPSIIATVDTLLHKVHPRTRAALAVRVFALGEDTYPPAPGEIVAFLIDSEFFRPKVDHIIPVVLDARSSHHCPALPDWHFLH